MMLGETDVRSIDDVRGSFSNSQSSPPRAPSDRVDSTSR
jgi:hypothetical protein